MLSQLLALSNDPKAVILKHNVADANQRVDNALAVLATGCELSSAAELRRFQHCRDLLMPPLAGFSPENLLGAVTTMVGNSLPAAFEFVLSHTAGRQPRFGYLTQGRSTGELPTSMGQLLTTALQIFLEEGGAGGEASLLAEMFRLGFPELAALNSYAATTQALLIGFVPSAHGVDLKAYFNTRIQLEGPGVPSLRDRVAAMAAAVRAADLSDRADATDPSSSPAQALDEALVMRAYDALYDRSSQSHFAGVGVDLTQQAKQAHRFKLYIRCKPSVAAEHLACAADALGLQVDASALQRSFDADLVADEMELGVALCGGKEPAIKATLFFPSTPHLGDDSDSSLQAAKSVEATLDCARQFLKEMGHETALFDEVVRKLRSTRECGAVRANPLHGIGVQYPELGQHKVNVYLQPVL